MTLHPTRAIHLPVPGSPSQWPGVRHSSRLDWSSHAGHIHVTQWPPGHPHPLRPEPAALFQSLSSRGALRSWTTSTSTDLREPTPTDHLLPCQLTASAVLGGPLAYAATSFRPPSPSGPCHPACHEVTPGTHTVTRPLTIQDPSSFLCIL